MRQKYIIGNWKMNKTNSEAIELVNGIKEGIRDMKDKNVIICPPFTALSTVKELISGTNIELGAQNCSYAEKGAFTGEISCDMLKSVGCKYVILGHSERRTLFFETDEIINKKATLAISKGLKVIICVGETLEERENKKTFDIIKLQIINSLKDLDLNNVIIAYEPIWAIGTGETASPIEAEEVHSFIRDIINKNFSNNCFSGCCSIFNIAENISILYGGSVNLMTIGGLMKCKNIDGGLVGGASLKIKDFIDIIMKL